MKEESKKQEKSVSQRFIQFLFERIGLVVLILTSMLIVISVFGYFLEWNWTGLPGTVVIEGTVEKNIPGKTLWNWLELLIIPVMLAGGAFWIRKQEEENRRAREKAEERTAILVENQRAQENALETYLDRMSELLLEKGLGAIKVPDEVVDVARTRTLTVLRRLDGDRKAVVIRFLYEAKLIVTLDEHGKPIQKAPVRLSLDSADLTKVNLSGAYMPCIDLSRAYLMDADLSGAHLEGAKLTQAILDGADLKHTQLQGAVMTGSWLLEANLSYTHLERAGLFEATMDRAILKNAYLDDASIKGTSLHGVVDLDCEQLTKAKYWQEAFCDDNLDCKK